MRMQQQTQQQTELVLKSHFFDQDRLQRLNQTLRFSHRDRRLRSGSVAANVLPNIELRRLA